MTRWGLPGSLTWGTPQERGGGAPCCPRAPHHSQAPDGSGPEPSCSVPVGKLTLARKNQEEAQMTHCPTSSKVKTEQCVWPLGLDIIAALASPTVKIKALSQQYMRRLGMQPMGLFCGPIPHAFSAVRVSKFCP